MTARSQRARSQIDARPERLGWLPPLVFLVNLAVLGLLMAYSSLNLRPDLSAVRTLQAHTYYQWTVAAAAVTPALAAIVFLWPALRWLRRRRMDRAGDAVPDVPITIAFRAANAPLALAVFSLLGWVLVTTLAGARALASAHDISLGLAVHLVLRPALAGLIAGAATFFGAEYLSALTSGPRSSRAPGSPGTRGSGGCASSHRLLGLWLAISALPLSAVALTTFTRVAGLELAAHPVLGRLVSVILLIAASAAVGGHGSPGSSRVLWLDPSRRSRPQWPACATATSTRASR